MTGEERPRSRDGWPSDGEVAALGESHRRAVAAALHAVARRLAELESAGLARVPRDAMAGLERTLAALGGERPRLAVPSLVVALRVTVEELEPDRMARYGPLEANQRATLERLARALARTLDGVEPTGGEAAPALTARPIGVVRSPFRTQEGTPIQPGMGRRAEGRVEVAPEYREALADLDGFERIWLICWLDRARTWRPRVAPYRDDRPRGLFATRAPSRPNPIGMSPVRLLRIEGCVLHVAELDLLDGTPVLDIKPYVGEFDAFPAARSGWLESVPRREEADARFEPEG